MLGGELIKKRVDILSSNHKLWVCDNLRYLSFLKNCKGQREEDRSFLIFEGRKGLVRV